MGEFGPRPPTIDETFVLERAVLAASAGEEAPPANTARNLLRAVLAGEAMRLRLAGQLTGGTDLAFKPSPNPDPTSNPNPNPTPTPYSYPCP